MAKKSYFAVAMVSAMALSIAGCGNGAEEGPAAVEAQAVACDRECLLTIGRQYLTALSSNDVAAAGLANDAVFVENVTKMKAGEGLWKSITGPVTDFSILVPDTSLQQIGWLGVVEQDGKPAVAAIRLKVMNGTIVEAEHLVTPPAQGEMKHLLAIRPGLLTTIPEADRMSHADLIKLGASYYDALDDNDGSKMPFAEDCQRHENGMVTAGKEAGPPPNWQPGDPRAASDCKGQLDSQTFVYIDKIDSRRMIAADPETGLVMGFSHLRHPMTNLPYKVTNSDGSITERNKANMPYDPFDMPAAHIFKVGPDKKIHEIEAVGVKLPFNSPTGWE